MAKNMHGMGEGIMIVWPVRTSISYQGFNKGRSLDFLEEDAFLLQREVPQVAAISAEYSRWNVTMNRTRTPIPRWCEGFTRFTPKCAISSRKGAAGSSTLSISNTKSGSCPREQA